MRVGNYKIGRYYGIIKNSYADGSVSYETDFSSYSDFSESLFACRCCIGEVVGTATDNPKELVWVEAIYGKENIMKEIG